MTIVCALEHEGKVWLGSDSLAAGEGFRFPETFKKLHKLGPWLVGCAGKSRVHEIIERHDELLEIDNIYLFRDCLFESIAQIYEPFAAKDGGAKGYECEFIVARDGQFWMITFTGTVWQSDSGFGAIGAGQDFAYGAHQMYLRHVRPMHQGAMMLMDIIECVLAMRTDCEAPVQIEHT